MMNFICNNCGCEKFTKQKDNFICSKCGTLYTLKDINLRKEIINNNSKQKSSFKLIYISLLSSLIILLVILASYNVKVKNKSEQLYNEIHILTEENEELYQNVKKYSGRLDLLSYYRTGLKINGSIELDESFLILSKGQSKVSKIFFDNTIGEAFFKFEVIEGESIDIEWVDGSNVGYLECEIKAVDLGVSVVEFTNDANNDYLRLVVLVV